jgi:hypothetical protein
MSDQGVIRLKNGLEAQLYGDKWRCNNKIIQLWLNVRYGRWMQIPSYLYAPAIRLEKAAEAFEAIVIEAPIDDDEEKGAFY